MKTKLTNFQIGMLRVAAGTAFILLIPLVAMQFTSDVDWGLLDFIIIGTLLFSAGLLHELLVRNTRDNRRRIIIGAVIAVAVLYIWAELAVGIFTNLGS